MFPSRCSICAHPLLGLIQIDAWGNRYCTSHENDYPFCSCCHRLICDRLTKGGVAYRDGRLVCNLCRRTAIDTKEQAKPYVEAMAAWLYNRGFAFKNLGLRIELLHSHELAARSGATRTGQVRGMILTRLLYGRGGVQREVVGVALLKGLSRHILEGVTIHELGHAWLFLEEVDGLPLPIEEGFCNLLSYLYHSSVNSSEARFCKLLIEQNPDPVYGDGFRLVQQSTRRRGLPATLAYLRQYRRLPP